MMSPRIHRPILMLVLASTAILVSCYPSDPLQIGLVAGLSGKSADLGTAGRNGAMLAVEERNSTGGIHGKKVELVIRDDKQDPVEAKVVCAELIAMKIPAIIGPMTSNVAMALVPLVNASDSILISPTVTTTSLLGLDDNFLRVISVTTDYASKAARYQFQKLGQRSVAIMYDLNNKAYTEDWIRGFRRVFEDLGGTTTAMESFKSSDQVLFLDTVKVLLGSKPDMLLIVSNAVDAALIAQQVRGLDAKMPIVMSEWASTERFIELAGSASEGITVAQFIDRNDQKAPYVRFKTAYMERFGQEPGFAGLAGYDAATIVLDALEQKKAGDSLKTTILNTATFPCVQQTITLDRFGDANRSTFVTVIRQGIYETVE